MTGRYDFGLHFAGNVTIPMSVASNPDLMAEDPAGAPDIFTALEKQIGLKLGKGKAMVDVLVIEHVEKIQGCPRLEKAGDIHCPRLF